MLKIRVTAHTNIPSEIQNDTASNDNKTTRTESGTGIPANMKSSAIIVSRDIIMLVVYSNNSLSLFLVYGRVSIIIVIASVSYDETLDQTRRH